MTQQRQFFCIKQLGLHFFAFGEILYYVEMYGPLVIVILNNPVSDENGNEFSILASVLDSCSRCNFPIQCFFVPFSSQY